jgi:hypothetical protein
MLTPAQQSLVDSTTNPLQKQMYIQRFEADNRSDAAIQAAQTDNPATVSQAQSYFETLKQNPSDPGARAGLLSMGIIPYSGFSFERQGIDTTKYPTEYLSPGLKAIQEQITKASGSGYEKLDPTVRNQNLYPDISFFGTPRSDWKWAGQGLGNGAAIAAALAGSGGGEIDPSLLGGAGIGEGSNYVQSSHQGQSYDSRTGWTGINTSNFRGIAEQMNIAANNRDVGLGNISKYVNDSGEEWKVANSLVGSFGQLGVTAGVRPTLFTPGGYDTGIPKDSSTALTAKASAIASQFGGAIGYGRNNQSNTLDLDLVNLATFSVFAPGTTPGNEAKYGSSQWFNKEIGYREAGAILNNPFATMPGAEPGTYYMRIGNKEQKVTGDLIYGQTGEWGLFRNTFDPNTGLPRSEEVMFAGGGKNALQAGALSLTSFYPTTDLRYAEIVRNNPDLFSRPGAEMYGGMVMPLGNRITPGAQYGEFPSWSGNLAGIVNPNAVNAGREALPSVNIPGTMPSDMMGQGILQITRGGAGNYPTFEIMGGSPVAVGVGGATPAPAQENLGGLPAPFVTMGARAPEPTEEYTDKNLSNISPWLRGIAYSMKSGGFIGSTARSLQNIFINAPEAISLTLWPKSPEMLTAYEASNKTFNQKVAEQNTFFSGLKTETINGVPTFKYDPTNPSDMALFGKLESNNADIKNQYSALETQRVAIVSQQKKEETRGVGGLWGNIESDFSKTTTHPVMPNMKGWAAGVESGMGTESENNNAYSQSLIYGANIAEGLYAHVREKPVQTIAEYLTLKVVFPAAEAGISSLIAKGATSTSPVWSTIGRAASAPLAADVGTLLKTGMGASYVYGEGSRIMAEPTIQGKGKVTGDVLAGFTFLTAGALNPMTFPKAENPYAMREFFSGERAYSPLQKFSMDARAYITSFEVPENLRGLYRSIPAAFREVRFIEPQPGITETTAARPFTEPDISLASTIGDARAPGIRAAIGEQEGHVIYGSVVMEGQRTGLPTGELIRGAPNIHDLDLKVPDIEKFEASLLAHGETRAGMDIKDYSNEPSHPMANGAVDNGEGIRRIGILSRIFGEAIPSEQGYKLPLADEVLIGGEDYTGVLNQEPMNVQAGARKYQAFMQDLVPAEGKAGNPDARMMNEQFRIPKDFYDATSGSRDLIAGKQAAALQAGGKTPIGTATTATDIIKGWDKEIINFDFMPEEDNPIIGAKKGVQFTKDMTLGEIRLAYEDAITSARAGGQSPASLFTPNPAAAPYNPGYLRSVTAALSPASGGVVGGFGMRGASWSLYAQRSTVSAPSQMQLGGSGISISSWRSTVSAPSIITSSFGPDPFQGSGRVVSTGGSLSPVSLGLALPSDYSSQPSVGGALSPYMGLNPASASPGATYGGSLMPYLSGLSSPSGTPYSPAPSGIFSPSGVSSPPGSPYIFISPPGSPSSPPSPGGGPPSYPWIPHIPGTPLIPDIPSGGNQYPYNRKPRKFMETFNVGLDLSSWGKIRGQHTQRKKKRRKKQS